MPDGLSIPLFYMIVGAIWLFVKITTPHERQTLLEWSLIVVVVFGSAGFLYGLFTGRL